LAPFAHSLGSDAGQPSRGIRPTETFYDMINRNRHTGNVWEENSHDNHSAGRLGIFFREKGP
jgi:hypothetical protein